MGGGGRRKSFQLEAPRAPISHHPRAGRFERKLPNLPLRETGRFRLEGVVGNRGCWATRPLFLDFAQETTKDPKVEGSRSYQSSVAPFWRGTEAAKHLFYCVSVQSERGG